MARLTDSEWKVMEALWQGGPQTLGEVLAQFPQILEDPAPSIWISKYGASSIEYVVRMWTAAGDYWDVDRLDWYYDRWIDNGAEAWYREATAYALDNSLILPFGRSFEGGEVLNRGQFVAILSCPASCALQITGTCRIQKDCPRNIAIVLCSNLFLSCTSL